MTELFQGIRLFLILYFEIMPCYLTAVDENGHFEWIFHETNQNCKSKLAMLLILLICLVSSTKTPLPFKESWSLYHYGIFHQFIGSRLLRPFCLGENMLFVIGTSQDDETAM